MGYLLPRRYFIDSLNLILFMSRMFSGVTLGFGFRVRVLDDHLIELDFIDICKVIFFVRSVWTFRLSYCFRSDGI